MAKKILSMTYQVSLRSRFTSFLEEHNIPYEREYVWVEIYCGYKKIVEVKYTVDEVYMDTIRLQSAADTTRGISYREKSVA